MRPFLNKASLSKSFGSLRSAFQRAIYDVSKFFLVLAFFGEFEMTPHVIYWLMLLRRCFIHLVIDDDLYDRKDFYTVKIVFYSSSMNNGEFING